MQLRPYQQDAINNLRSSIVKGYTKPLLQAATGSGKTVIAGTIINSANIKNHRVLFVVDTIDLVDQAVETFQRMGLDVGVMQGFHELDNSMAMTQVCTAQTLAARISKDQIAWQGYPVGLIVIDEAHVQYAVRDKLAELYPNAPIIGLSATPFSKGLGRFYDDLIVAVPMQQLIDEGHLKPFRVYAPDAPDLDGVKSNSKGDYDANETHKRYTPPIVANIVKTWKQLGEGRPTIGFAVNVAMSKAMAAEFVANGINAEHVDGYGSSPEVKQERFETIERFKAGKVDVLWNVGIATKGFDAPRVSCIIDAAPTKSLSLFVQKWGRGTRVLPGGDVDCIVLDHSGNVLRSGLPPMISINELDDGKKGNASDRKQKDEPLPKVCTSTKCNFVKEPKQHECPKCGFAPEVQNTVEVQDGKLVEFDAISAKQKLDWMYMFNTIRIKKGYKIGWAIFKYKSKFKEEPAVLWPKKELEPTPEVLNWLKHEQIKYAKGKAKQEKANASA